MSITSLIKLVRIARRVLERLSSRPKIGGLQVSDSGLYFVLDETEGQSRSLRIPPGVMTEGKVEDRDRFVELLKQFRTIVFPANESSEVPIVVSLPPALVYTQSFSVPVSAESIEEAATLNLQMISPLPKEGAYMAWQRIQDAPDHIECLGAFAEKTAVDAILTALAEAHFYPVAVEFPSFSLARIVGKLYRTSSHPLLVFQLSSDGLNLFLYWNGSLYFDYFRSWRSIQGEAREISRERFDEVVTQEVQKVVNFTLSRFQEAPAEVFLVAPGFEEAVASLLRTSFALKTLPIDLPGFTLAPTWYPALGAALRGGKDRGRDAEISLAPVSSSSLFYQEQLVNFIRLWRGIAVAILALFLVFFGGAASLLRTQERSLESQLTIFNADKGPGELSKLRSLAERFNTLVRLVAEVRAQPNLAPDSMALVTEAFSGSRVVPVSITLPGPGSAATVAATSPDYDTMIAFKNKLATVPHVTNVDLPLARVTQQENGSLAFTISFEITF